MARQYLLNLRELVNGSCNRLRYVTRFSNCRVLRGENVAEHQYFTALYALVIGEYLRQKGVHVNTANLLSFALLHDAEEQFTGDVVRPVKHTSDEVKEHIRLLGERLIWEWTATLFKRYESRDILQQIWCHSKSDSIESKILEFCDYLSVLSYVDQEIRSGNSLITENINHLEQYSKRFDNKEYKFMSELVLQSRSLLTEILQHKRRMK